MGLNVSDLPVFAEVGDKERGGTRETPVFERIILKIKLVYSNKILRGTHSQN